MQYIMGALKKSIEVSMSESQTILVHGGNEMDSILISIKKLLGITADCTDFDADIIMHINSVLMVLKQIGVGPEEGYSITGDTETWADFFGELPNLPAIKSYVYLKVRLLFDPPQSSALLESTKQLVAELEWRLNADADEALQKENQ